MTDFIISKLVERFPIQSISYQQGNRCEQIFLDYLISLIADWKEGNLEFEMDTEERLFHEPNLLRRESEHQPEADEIDIEDATHDEEAETIEINEPAYEGSPVKVKQVVNLLTSEQSIYNQSILAQQPPGKMIFQTITINFLCQFM
jgi:hypothetical protein